MKIIELRTLLSLIAAAFFISGCGAADLMPLRAVSSGPYSIEILTPGGRLKSGDNPILIRVSENGQPTAASNPELMFSMPAMGTMPYMEMQTVFSQTAEEEGLSGVLKFNMGGSWTGHLELTVGGTPVSDTFPMRVDD